MQRFELFASLPSSTSCIILQDWLNLKSLIALDTAFCCHSHRSLFVELVQSDEYNICEQVTITSEREELKLLQKFGEKLRSINILGRLSFQQNKLIVERCQKLTHVRFRRYGAFNDAFLNIFSSRIVCLDASEVYLDHCMLVQIMKLCPCLRTLGLANTDVTDNLLNDITEACPRIAHLDIARNDELTDWGILGIMTNLIALRGLNIEGCTRLTDASLVHIYTHCADTLHTLQMNTCDARGVNVATYAPAFSVSVIHTLLKICIQLHTLHIAGPDVYNSPNVAIPLIAFQNLTTLVLGDVVCADNIESIGPCLKLRTLVINHFDSEESFLVLVRNAPDLLEIQLNVDLQQCRALDRELADLLEPVLQILKPGIVVKYISPSNDYSKYHVMRM